ncbi:MAG: hypothetical protein RMJ98_08255 [Myxococcales bacterium]|nr:hypothetical protein [Polyangiaceae bacterium]MDW8249279.1 hypothetical protein [Myxococcales bacterium]
MQNASQLKPVMIRRPKGELRRYLANCQILERETLQVDLDGLATDAPELLQADKLATHIERRDGV